MDEEILIEDLRNKKPKKNNSHIFQRLFIWLWNKRWYVLLSIIIIIVLLKPVETGTFIGKWITNFIGSLWHNINIK